MPKIGTYDPASTLTGSEELVGVQGGGSVHITPDQFKQLIKNPRYLSINETAVAGDFISADTTGGGYNHYSSNNPINQSIDISS